MVLANGLPVKGAIALRKNRKSLDDDEQKRGIAAALLTRSALS